MAKSIQKTNAMRLLAAYHHTGKLEGFNIFDIPNDIIASTLNSCIPASAIDGFLAFLQVISKIGNFDHAVHEVWNNGGKNLKIDKKNLNLITLPLAQLVCSAHQILDVGQHWHIQQHRSHPLGCYSNHQELH